MNNKQLVYGGFIAIIASIVAAIYFGCASSTEKRTNYPGWDQTTDQAYVPNTGPLWTTGATGSNERPNYLGNGPTYGTDKTQKELTASWIESKVGSGDSTSWTSMKENAITSIIVRDVNGEDKEFPIMDFFKKIHEDIKLGFTRAKDYTDYAMELVTVVAEAGDKALQTEYTRLIEAEKNARMSDDLANMVYVNGELSKKVPQNNNLHVRFLDKGHLYTDWMGGVKANGGAPGEMIQIFT